MPLDRGQMGAIEAEMNGSRRIDPSKLGQENAGLKEIAGRLQKLSYREMAQLARFLDSKVRSECTNDFAEILLAWADEQLSEGRTKAPEHDGRGPG